MNSISANRLTHTPDHRIVRFDLNISKHLIEQKLGGDDKFIENIFLHDNHHNSFSGMKYIPTQEPSPPFPK